MNYINLTEKYGTPLFVYDGDLIIRKYHEFDDKVFYAMKANYNVDILRILLREGSCIDAVSPGEVLLALKIGFSKEKILFTANMITDEEMEEVQKLGVLFNIGSLSRLEKYGLKYPGSEVCIRFNPDVIAGEHEYVVTGGKGSKFGILLEDIEKVKEIVSKYDLKVIGLHEHTGSGIDDIDKMMESVKNLLSLVEHFPDLKFIDFGGGFKVPYKPDEERIDYGDFFRRIKESIPSNLEIYFEPGKFIVAEAGTLLVKVTTIKRNIVGVNSGMNHLIRPILYGAYHRIENISNPNGEKKSYDVVGNICESGDYFAKDRELPEVREGDILAIRNAGAYCYSMASLYNLRALPGEVTIIDGKEFVRKRKTNQEIV